MELEIQVSRFQLQEHVGRLGWLCVTMICGVADLLIPACILSYHKALLPRTFPRRKADPSHLLKSATVDLKWGLPAVKGRKSRLHRFDGVRITGNTHSAYEESGPSIHLKINQWSVSPRKKPRRWLEHEFLQAEAQNLSWVHVPKPDFGAHSQSLVKQSLRNRMQ